MLRHVRTFALAAVAAVAALLPLYGDPRSAPVTHPEWARMLLRGMDMESALESSASASRVFSTLSWRESLWLPAARYMRAEGVRLVPVAGREPNVSAEAELAEAVYPLTVVRRGEYRLRVRIAGSPDTPALAEITGAGASEPEKSYTLVPAPALAWLEPGEPAHLEPGTYYATFALPKGVVLEQFEIAPPCVTAIEPLDGWEPADVLDAEDLAVTLLRAIDLEGELPPSDMPIELTGADFQRDETMPSVISASSGSLEALWLRAGAAGTRATVFVDVPESGVYSLSAFGLRGQGQQWMADECRASVLCPVGDLAAGESEAPAWLPILTAPFDKGRHYFSVTLAPHSGIERIRLERKKATGADYVATVRRLGFDPGDGPVSRARAADALEWLTRRYEEFAGRPCQEIELETRPSDTQILASGQQIQGPQATPPFGGPPAGPPPFGGPGVEPPTGPPSTVPCQPPASPIDPEPCPSPE